MELPDTGSTKFLWVWYGKSYILLKETFQLFSSITASAENKSQIGDPVKWELKILFASNLDFGWENKNSCKSSQFLSMYPARLILMSLVIPLY